MLRKKMRTNNRRAEAKKQKSEEQNHPTLLFAFLLNTGAFLSCRNRVIAFFMLHLQARQSARRFHCNLDLVPLAVFFDVGRQVSNAVLIAKFQCDSGRRVFQFRR